jgi:DNA-binding transcriptional ArsR family regulator
MSENLSLIGNHVLNENCSPIDDAEKTAQSLGKMFAALAHPARSRIILELGRGQLCVNDLSEMLKISHSSVSQHLAILRSQSLIKEQKAGRFVFYRLLNSELASWLAAGERFTELTDPANGDANNGNGNHNGNGTHNGANTSALAGVPAESRY